MKTFRLDTAKSELRVTAHSSVHDTVTTWKESLSGHVELDGDSLESAKASIAVDMTKADTGDWLKNRKMRKDMDFSSHPKAEFALEGLTVESREPSPDGESIRATISGTLHWRGKSVSVRAQGTGTLGESSLRAQGQFRIDLRSFGIKPPKVLMFKIEDEVSCVVELEFRA